MSPHTGLKTVLGSAVMLLAAQQGEASSVHNHHHHHHHLERKHLLSPRKPFEEPGLVVKKSVQCRLPDDPDLHFVPGGMNNGFAMSPDQPCNGNMWCPIACKAGKVMAQWKPGSSYTYPESMAGGLFCDGDGRPHKAFDDKPYCVDGTGTVSAVNQCGKPLSICQTVLPGNEAMLIPTIAPAGGSAVLAVPDTSYWCGTAAHYYVNPPGVLDEGCIWGTPARPVGNWSPYTVGANTDANGLTFVKVGWNPIFEFEGLGLEKTLPDFGVRITCPGGGCVGLPCEIDPTKGSLGGVISDLKAAGAGGSQFCVVTVPPGKHANIVMFPTDGSSYEAPDSGAPAASANPAKPSAVQSKPKPKPSGTKKKPHPTIRPGIFHENGTESDGDSSSKTKATAPTASLTSSNAIPTSSKPSEGARRQQGSAAISGLIVALVAAAYFY